jgi:hypothetical protein
MTKFGTQSPAATPNLCQKLDESALPEKKLYSTFRELFDLPL